MRRIKRYEEQKDKKTVTLNREKFLAERAEMNTDKEEEGIYDKLSDPNRPVFDMENDYNKEALDITVDYLQLLGGNRVAEAHRQGATPRAWPLGSAEANSNR